MTLIRAQYWETNKQTNKKTNKQKKQFILLCQNPLLWCFNKWGKQIYLVFDTVVLSTKEFILNPWYLLKNLCKCKSLFLLVSLHFFKISYLSLNFLNWQIIVRGRPWCWQDSLQDLTGLRLSISTSAAKPKLFFRTAWIFSSHVFHVSFGISWEPSFRR